MNTQSPACFVYGVGGHAKVVIDAWQRTGGTWAGCFDDAEARIGADFAGMRVRAYSPPPPRRRIHVAIGNNSLRQAVAQRVLGVGDELFSVIHPLASIAITAHCGAGTLIAAAAVIGPDVAVGKGCIINHGAVVDHDCVVGDWTHIAPGVVLGGAVRIGATVLIGAGAVVLPGVTVNDNAIVGAGAVVRRDVAAGSIVAGVPAKQLESSTP